MDLHLKSKVALVTGGSRGIGKATARQLAREGVSVALAARDRAALDAAAAEIAKETGVAVKGFTVDTGDDASVKAMVAEVVAAFGRIDILVNAAAQAGGQSKPPQLSEITNELFYADMNIKVLGYLRVAREVAPLMARQGWGRIINISGLAARQTGTTIGSMRNVAVAAMSKNLAEELSPQGIGVVCVHPGVTVTEKSQTNFETAAKRRGVTAEQVAKEMGARTLAGRLITAEEVADLVTFLASPRSVSVNGESVGAGGGAPGVIHY